MIETRAFFENEARQMSKLPNEPTVIESLPERFSGVN